MGGFHPAAPLDYDPAMLRRALLSLALCSSCVVPRAAWREAPPAFDAAKLEAIAERAYAAPSPEVLKAAVADARALSPEAPLTHELEALLARLEGRDAEVFTHLEAALLSPGDDAAWLHLEQLHSMVWNFEEWDRALALNARLAAEHPSPDVRALAAWHLAVQCNTRGDLRCRDAALARVEGRLPLAVVGTWDNDQNKGFDTQYGPELDARVGTTYAGRRHRLAWRSAPPLDPLGRVDFGDLLVPTRNVVAYAQSELRVPPGQYTLRLTTSDPVKVWLGDALVFSDSTLDQASFDQVVIPLVVPPGPQRLLIKSAQKDGRWLLLARLVPHPTPLAPVRSLDAALAFHRAERLLPQRARAHEAELARLVAPARTTLARTERWVNEVPASQPAKAAFAEALWNAQERGRTADVLAALDEKVGEAWPWVRQKHARFLWQQGRKTRARGLLDGLEAKAPTLRDAVDLRAEDWRAERWYANEVATLRAGLARNGESAWLLRHLALAEDRLGHHDTSLELRRRLLAKLPASSEGRWDLMVALRNDGDLGGAEALLRAHLAQFPNDLDDHLALAELLRRQRRHDEAKAVLDRALALSPNASAPVEAQGNLAWERGDRAPALAFWREALARNPDDDALAQRLELVAPDAPAPFMADVPTEAQLEAIVARRAQLVAKPGADLAYLLDHEVTELHDDGSTSSVVTAVLHAFNTKGRDQLLKQTLEGAKKRLLHAWALDEQGVRVEASAERAGQVFFRGLGAGSTVVLQYRRDQPGAGYFPNDLTQTWRFQGFSDQREHAEWVLWLPQAMKLQEASRGALKREEEVRGPQRRLRWWADQQPPLVYETAMPSRDEVGASLTVSTIKSWQTWLTWERALLDGVFRLTPEVKAKAKALQGKTPHETVRNVHQFVMEEIRYQQDYEAFINGVKPHGAATVLERRYGDCKDKAVLFISLLDALGLEAHFALIRTREHGPVDERVPRQGFNHAIVWVPAQTGLAEARFYDPTAESMDLDVLRPDDASTRSLVLDPKDQDFAWRDVPEAKPNEHTRRSELSLVVAPDGSAKGTVRFTARGAGGSALRQTLRQADSGTRALQRWVSALLPGAVTSNASWPSTQPLDVPATAQANVEAQGFARQEDGAWRITFPAELPAVRTVFQQPSRMHPLQLGTPMRLEVETAVALPPGATLKTVPKDVTVSGPCFSWQRTVKQTAGALSVLVVAEATCDRVETKDYATARTAFDELARRAEDGLVFVPAKGATKSAGAR